MHMGQAFSGSSSSSSMPLSTFDDSSSPSPGTILQLAPVQSCSLHGWSNPKRTLSWEDVVCNPAITLQQCMRLGLRPEQLHELQPDVSLWIRHKRVSFADVPYMACWPLHPIADLKGDISDIATMHYDAQLLKQLGISYRFMRSELRMDDDWMRMLRYRPREWKQHLDFDERCASEMGEQRVHKVFGMDMGMLRVAMNASM